MSESASLPDEELCATLAGKKDRLWNILSAEDRNLPENEQERLATLLEHLREQYRNYPLAKELDDLEGQILLDDPDALEREELRELILIGRAIHVLRELIEYSLLGNKSTRHSLTLATEALVSLKILHHFGYGGHRERQLLEILKVTPAGLRERQSADRQLLARNASNRVPTENIKRLVARDLRDTLRKKGLLPTTLR